jgi:hypothetical protein
MRLRMPCSSIFIESRVVHFFSCSRIARCIDHLLHNQYRMIQIGRLCDGLPSGDISHPPRVPSELRWPDCFRRGDSVLLQQVNWSCLSFHGSCSLGMPLRENESDRVCVDATRSTEPQSIICIYATHFHSCDNINLSFFVGTWSAERAQEEKLGLMGWM